MSVSTARPVAQQGIPIATRMRVFALVAICLAELLVVLDNTLVNVALPSMAVQLQARMSGLQ